MCYSIDSPESLQNVIEKWYPEVHESCPNVPIILVGTKKDLRSDFNKNIDSEEDELRLVTHEEGIAMAEKIAAYGYLECSALTKEGVAEVFRAATRATLGLKLKEKRSFKLWDVNYVNL